jgi:hypothetical protein
MSKSYYWNEPAYTFAKVHEFGADITEQIKGDPRLEKWLKSGKVSTEKPTAKQPKMGEVDALKAQVATLQEQLKEKTVEADKLAVDGNKANGKFTKDDIDAAKAESVQADLDRIASLEKNAAGTAAETLDLVKVALSEIKQADKKEEILDKVREINSWFEESK